MVPQIAVPRHPHVPPRKPCTEFVLLLPPYASRTCRYIISPFAGKVHQERLSPRQSREITPIMRATAIFISRLPRPTTPRYPPNPTFCLNITSICPRGEAGERKVFPFGPFGLFHRGQGTLNLLPSSSSSSANKRSFVIRRRNRKFHLNLSALAADGLTLFLSFLRSRPLFLQSRILRVPKGEEGEKVAGKRVEVL